MFLRGKLVLNVFWTSDFASSNLLKEIINDVHKGLATKMSTVALFPTANTHKHTNTKNSQTLMTQKDLLSTENKTLMKQQAQYNPIMQTYTYTSR